MEKLSFEKMPHYIFSANRQFEKNEYHMNRIFNESVLILMRKGVLRFNENGVPVQLNAGEYYIQKAGLNQQGVTPSDSPNYFFIHFSGHFDERGVLPIKGTFDIDEAQKIISEIEMLGNFSQRLEYESLFYKLLCLLKSGMHKQSTPEIIREYLLKNFERNVTLEEIEKITFISKNQIINVFKEAYGNTPHQYLIDFRLIKAGELLLATNLSLTEICFRVGFGEYSGFYKAFIQKYGESPQDYRKRHSTDAFPKGIYYDPLI